MQLDFLSFELNRLPKAFSSATNIDLLNKVND